MNSATSINGTEAERLAATEGPGGRRRETPDPSASPGSARTGSGDDTLQPWHFFVLLSLVAATAAVVLAREGRPEHLVLISLTIGAAGFAAAALYRTLAPLVGKDEAPPAGELSESMRAVLEREKLLVLRSIKDLEFDRAMGKVSAKDFDEMAGRLRARAMSLMRQLDTGAGYRELIERELQARLSSSVARMKRPARPGSKDPSPTGGEPARPSAVPESSVVVAGSSAVAEAMVDAGALTKASDPGLCACGTANDADAAFCKRCGAKLATGTGA